MIPFSEVRKLWLRELANFPKDLYLVNSNVGFKYRPHWETSATIHYLSLSSPLPSLWVSKALHSPWHTLGTQSLLHKGYLTYCRSTLYVSKNLIT